MGDVRSLHGEEILPPGQPDPEVVKTAEDLLERAKSGDLCGLCVVLSHADDTTSFEIVGRCGRAAIGTIEILKYHLIKIGL